MNQRLEEEIDKMFGISGRDSNGRPIQDVSDWKEAPDVMMSMNQSAIRQFAQHFYNLALEDVKKEVERLCEKAKCGEGEYRNGAQHTLITIKDFIEKQEI